MPRTSALPQREVEICQRLRAFREKTQIARTVFAAEAGVVGARLLNCELGVTPLSYGLFRAVNIRFHVRPEWLVYEMGKPTGKAPFDPGARGSKIDDRELLSSVCDRFFKQRFEEEYEDARAGFFGPGGVLAWMDEMTEYFQEEPEGWKQWPAERHRQFARLLGTMFSTVYEGKTWEELPPELREFLPPTAWDRISSGKP